MVILPIVARPLADNLQHRREVEEIVMARADYFQFVEGCPPRPGEVEDFFNQLPPDCAPADKSLLGFIWTGKLPAAPVCGLQSSTAITRT